MRCLPRSTRIVLCSGPEEGSFGEGHKDEPVYQSSKLPALHQRHSAGLSDAAKGRAQERYLRVSSTILIDMVFPICVVGLCVWFYHYMRRSGVENPPFVRLFILIASFASIIWFALSFFFASSGAAEYVVAPVLFIASPLIIVIAFLSFVQRKESGLHKAAYLASISYGFAFVFLISLLSTRCPPHRGGPP